MKATKQWFTLLTILLCCTLGQVVSDLYLPSLPAMATHFAVSASAIQLTVTVFMVGFSLSQLFYGPISDGLGRKNPLIIGLLISIVGSILCASAPSITMVYGGRLLQGLGVGACTALGRPILRDLFSGRDLAHYNSIVAIFAVFVLSTAPALGGYIQQHWGWRWNFVILTIHSGFVFLLVLLQLSETNPHIDCNNLSTTVLIQNVKTLLTNKIFLRFVLMITATYAGMVVWLTAAPIVLQNEMGLKPAQMGWLYLCSGVGFFLGGLCNSLLVKRLGIEWMIRLGIALQIIAGITMWVLALDGWFTPWVVIVPIGVMMLGSSLIFPNAIAGALTPFPKMAGMSAALLGFIQIGGGVLSSALIALIHDDNQIPMAVAFILIGVISLSTLIASPERIKK